MGQGRRALSILGGILVQLFVALLGYFEQRADLRARVLVEVEARGLTHALAAEHWRAEHPVAIVDPRDPLDALGNGVRDRSRKLALPPDDPAAPGV